MNVPAKRTTRLLVALFLMLSLSVDVLPGDTPSPRKPPKRQVDPQLHWFLNTYFRPVKHFFSLHRGAVAKALGASVAAKNVTPDGQVPDSAFYANRDPSHLVGEDIMQGPNTDDGPVPPITITHKKTTGASPGFFGTDQRGVKYLFKCDRPEWPEMITGAEMVGNRLMWVLGYNVPEASIITVSGTGSGFDGKRAVAIKFIQGEIVGPFAFRANRDLRELRALKLASCWINNTDIKELNSLVAWNDGKEIPYLIDFSNCLGSHTVGPKLPKAGWEDSFDLGAGLVQLVTLGLSPKPYDPDAKPFSKAVGLFDANFDPERWKPNYPVVPFWDMTRSDAEWMARKIAAVRDELIRAAVAAAGYSRKADNDYIVETLIKRRDTIARHYLPSQAPLARTTPTRD